MIDKKQFGKRISVLRKKLGLSQSELGEKFQVSTQAVSKWETGLALPDIDILLEMSWFFEIPINSLLEDSSLFAKSNVMTRAKLPSSIDNLVSSKQQKQLISSLDPYFTESELLTLTKHLSNNSLEVNLTIEATHSKDEYEKTVSIPVHTFSENTLRELAPLVSESVGELVGGLDRGIKRISEMMICPKCGESLKMHRDSSSKDVWFKCSNDHRFNVDEGVVYFGTREIPGELWSLSLRNYEHYLKEQTHPGLEVYKRGEVYSEELKWREIEKQRPRIILDVACGTGSGIKYILERINWNCVVILCDLSHRILKWNRKYFSENLNNPYVDMVYFACDCSNMPLKDGSVDCVTSRGGFESMQHKMMEGFKDSSRILKESGRAIYGFSTIESPQSPNSQKWIELLKTCDDNNDSALFEKMITIDDWKDKIKSVGFSNTRSIKNYNELPAPDTNVFPYENMVLRWMEAHMCISKK